MEKRVLIAFVLSFLLLVLWSFLYRPHQKQPLPGEQKGVTEKQEKVASQPLPPPLTKSPLPLELGQKGAEKVTPETREKEIEVETPLYKAVFSSSGAVIKSFKLKKYRVTTDPDSPLVELAHLQEGDQDFLQVAFDEQSRPGHEKIIYDANVDSIFLSPNSEPRELTFRSVSPDGVSTYQTFRFYPDRYPIDLEVKLVNHSTGQISGNFTASIMDLPPEKKGYYSFVGIAFLLNNKLQQIKSKKVGEEKTFSGEIGWIAYDDDYFISAIIPDDQSKGSFRGERLPSGTLRGTYLAPILSLDTGAEVSSRFTLYLGPRDLSYIKQLDKNLDKAINFGWTDIIAKPLLYVLRLCNQYVKNYGVSIIILTILIKILFWPLTHKSYKSMKEMQKLQPLMAKIREKYKNDKQQMQKETMSLYRTYKVNPMGGCLPMVIQIPVFFALYRILGTSIELRHAPFFLWINDLSAPDRLFNFPFSIPYMSPPYGIPVLTLLMGVSMYIQQKMTPTAGDPAQAKVMMFMPIIFTALFINFPSGLVLYWLTNNILSIAQQYRIIRKSA